MASQADIKVLTVPLGDPGADDKQLFVLRAPDAGKGGGLRIVSGYAVNRATLNAGTSFSLALHRYSSAATPVVNGTIAPAIGGTAATFWTTGVPQAFVVDDTYGYLAPGEWLVIDYQEDTDGNPTLGFAVIHYIQGK